MRSTRTTRENTSPRANASLFVPRTTPIAVVNAMTCAVRVSWQKLRDDHNPPISMHYTVS